MPKLVVPVEVAQCRYQLVKYRLGELQEQCLSVRRLQLFLLA